MEKLIVDKNKRKVIDSIFEHDTPNGKCYSIHFTDSDETIWCDNIDEVYIEIDKHFQWR